MPVALLRAAAGLCVAAGFLWSQQAPATPPRPPTVPFTRAELEAIPLVPPRTGESVKKTLFDGKTLNGWRGNLEWWSVADGAIAGKSTGKVPSNFLFTNDNYSDFRLTLSSRMVDRRTTPGSPSGVRSKSRKAISGLSAVRS